MVKRLAFIVFLLLGQATVFFAQCPITVDAGPDKYVCQPGAPVQLNGSISGPYLSYQWTPTTRLAPSTSLTPTATVLTTTTYTLTGKAVEGSNLIPNGDFESGNTGFSSEYNNSPGNLWPEGTYDVINNPQSSHANFQPCSDHTGGGQMMVINGAGTPGVDAWCSSAPVDPNTEYVFSVWACSVLGTSPAILQFSINGVLIGSSFTLPSTPCAWVRFYATWNSGSSGNADICLVNQNTILSGNDFAIDDIFFSPVCKETDDVTVTVVNLQARALPSSYVMPCANARIAISGAGSSEGDHITYLWTTLNGHIVNGETTLDPEVDRPGVYTLTVTFDDGNVVCTRTANVVVTVNPTPPTALIPLPDELSCITDEVELTVGSSLPPPYSFHWNTTNGSIQGSPDEQECIATAAGQYFVTVTSTSSGCTATANIIVFSNTQPPVARANSGLISCQNPTAGLSGAGSSTGSIYTYLWSTNDGAFAASTSTLNSAASLPGTYNLLVTNLDNGCTSSASTTVNSNFTPVVVNLLPTNQINCAVPTATLSTATTPSNVNFLWIATNGGSIQSGQNTPNIVAASAGTYAVIATHPLSGCRDTAIMAVTANTTAPALQVQPPGVLDCDHQVVTLSATGSSSGTGFTTVWTASNGGHIALGGTTLTPTVDAPGTYNLLITNTTNQCTATRTVQVLGDTTSVQAHIVLPGPLTCAQQSLVLSSSGSSTGGSIVNSWLNASGTVIGTGPTLSLNTPGNYRLLLHNTVNACRDTALVTVVRDTVSPNLSLAAPGPLNCAVNAITLAAQNATPGSFTYAWTPPPGVTIPMGQSTLAPTVNRAGTYTLIATNAANGCRDTIATTLVADTLAPIASLATPALIDCEHPTQLISGAGSSTGPNLVYHWTASNGGQIIAGQGSQNANVNAAGTYTLAITNTVNHCTASSSVQVLADTNAVQALIVVPGALTCAQQNLVLSSTGSSTGASIVRTWLNASGTNIGSGPTLPLNTPGTYRLLLHNTANACRDTAVATVLRDTVPPQLSLSTPGPLNCAVNAITLAGQNATPGSFTYAWTPPAGASIAVGQGTLNPTVNRAGTYTLVATNNANGCRDTISTTLIADTLAPIVSLATPALIDCRNPIQTISGTSTAAGPNPIYNWSVANGGHLTAGQGTPSIRVNAAGSYTFVVTNPLNQCSSSASVSVGIDTAAAKVLAVPEDTLTCIQVSTSIAAVSAPLAGGLTYLWTNTAGIALGTTASLSVSTPGTYQLAVQNVANGCTSTATAQVVEDKLQPAVLVLPPAVLNCALKESVLAVQSLAPGRTFTYNWSTANGNIKSGANTANPLVDSIGQYTLIATDAFNGCTTTAMATVSKDDAVPLARIAPPDTLTCLARAIPLDAAASSTGSDFTYDWSSANGHFLPGTNGTQASVDQQGVYQLLVTNTQNHCTATVSVVVAEDISRATVDAGASNTLDCRVSSLTLNGSSSGPALDFTYAWTSNNGALVSGQNTLSPTINKAGDYVLAVTKRSNGCVASDTVTILENKTPPLVAIARPDTLTCAVTSLTLQASASGQSPALQVIWTSAGNGLGSGQNTLTPSVNQPGTYFLKVVDPINGCAASDTSVVTENKTAPALGIAPADTITCAKPIVTLQATATGQSPTLQILWETDNGRFSAGQNTLVPTVDQPGTYQLTIVDPKNGCQTTKSITVQQNAAFPLADAGPVPTLTCAQPEVLLQGTMEQGANIQALWSTTGGSILGGSNTLTPKVNKPGVYVLSVTNPATGCTATASVTVLEDKVKPFANAGANDTLKCSLTFLRLNGTASEPASNFDYLWTTPNGNFTSDPKQLQPTVDAPGIYLLTVQNRVNGCTESSQVEILRDQKAPLSDAGKPANLTCALRETTLQGMASTGAGISHTWQTANGTIVSGQNTLTPLVSAAGVYQLLVVDATNGCRSLSSVLIGEDTIPPAANAGMAQSLTCARTSLVLQGSASATGNPPLSYLWTTANGNIAANANTLTPTISRQGTYILTVKNEQNGCSTTRPINIEVDSVAPALATTLPGVLTCAVGQVQLNAAVTNIANNGFQAQWIAAPGAHVVSGNNSLTPLVDKPGDYQLTVKNLVNGCLSTVNVNVTENKTPPLARAGQPVELTCAAPTRALDGSGSSSGANFTYAWLGTQILSGINTLAPVIGAAGTYTLLVLNQTNGCSSSATVTAVDNKQPPLALIAPPELLTCARDSIALNAKGSGSAAAFTSSWSTANGHFLSGTNTLNPVVNSPGSYVLTVQNTQNGCTSTVTTTVLEDKTAPGAKTSLPQPLSCIKASTSLLGSTAATYPVTYAWTAPVGGNISSGANTASPTVTQPGIYQLLVTNPANGCRSTATATVARLQPPSFQPNVRQPDCHAAAGSVTFESLAGDALPFRFALNGSSFLNTPHFEGLPPGSYTLQMRDALGCEDIKTVTIKTPFVPTLRIPAVAALEFGDSIQLLPLANLPNSSIASWSWSPAEGLSCSDCPRPYAKPLKNTQYELTITDLNGCATSAAVPIRVSRDRHVWAPNIFSPNGDGQNDFFTVYGKGVMEIRYLRIFDRWGNQVFLAESIPVNEDAVGWDGTFRGQTLVPGVFAWVAEVLFLDGAREVLSGDVTVWR